MANGHGGRRPGSGRRPGQTTKAKRDLMDMAKDKARAALDVLAEVMTDKTNPAAARVSAAVAVLDRGYGRPAQSVLIGGAPDAPPVQLNVSAMSTGALAEVLAALGHDAPSDAYGG